MSLMNLVAASSYFTAILFVSGWVCNLHVYRMFTKVYLLYTVIHKSVLLSG